MIEQTRFMWTAGVLVVAMLLCGAPAARGQDAAAPQTIDLRALWKDGQKSAYRIAQTEVTTTETAALPEPQVIRMDYVVGCTWEVTEAREGGGGTARMSTDDLTLTIHLPDGKTLSATAGSADAEAASYQTWIKAMTGATIEVEVNPDGTIESISGDDAVRANADPAIAEGLDERYFRNIAMEVATLTGGGERVSVGDTWTHSYTSGHQAGEMTYDTTYRFEGVETMAGVPVAVVSTEAKISLEPEIPEVPAGVPTPTVELTRAESRGQLLFDLSRHELVGTQGSQTIEITYSARAGDRQITVVTREATTTKMLRTAEE